MTGDFRMRHVCPVEISTPELVNTQDARNGRLVGLLLERGNEMNPLVYHLHDIDWAVFATLTWNNDAISSFYYSDAEQLRRKDFYGAMLLTCAKHNLRVRDLQWYCKTESGPNQRAHVNVLIGKQGLKDVAPFDFARIMQNVWTTGRYPKGLAKIEVFNPELHLNGIAYQAKNEFDSNGVPLPFFEEMSGPLKKELYAKVQSYRN